MYHTVLPSTDLEVLAEGLGAGGTLQLSARDLAWACQHPLWWGIAGGSLMEVAQQFVVAAELQVTHVAGEELDPHGGEGVSDPSSVVWEGGPTKSAQTPVCQVGLGVWCDRTSSAGGCGPAYLGEEECYSCWWTQYIYL